MKLKPMAGSERCDASVALRSTLAILRDNTLCAIATVDPDDGSPYIWTAFYCYSEDLKLHVLTPPQTHHGQHLAKNPSVAVAVSDSGQAWDSPKLGLQLVGTATPAKGTETAKGLALYLRRYPAAARIARHPSELAHIDARFYVVTIHRVRLFDERAFGEEVFVDLEVAR
jgi:uncharacterized protein YhbP (UPF0306 family)